MVILRQVTRRAQGAAILEFSLVTLVVLTAFAALVDFGLYLTNTHNFEAAARDAVRYAATRTQAELTAVAGAPSAACQKMCGAAPLQACCNIKTLIVDPWLSRHPNMDGDSITFELTGPTALPAGQLLCPSSAAGCDAASSCNKAVTVSLRGAYRFGFLNIVGSRNMEVARKVSMRWLRNAVCD